jgi:hypothetical protein
MTLSSAAVPANLQLIDGEMLVWNDEPAGGPALAELLSELSGGGRALLAGLHDDALIARLEAGGTAVTCLLRAYPDAERVAAAHPGARVLCGNLTKVDPGESFDLVVAAGGLERPNSAEGPQLDWGQTAARLAAAVADGGTLVLVQENLLGVHQLTAQSPWYAERTDAAWTPVGDLDETRPATLAELEVALAKAGLATDARLLAFGDPVRPTVLVPVDSAADPGLRPYLEAVVADATGRATKGRELLTDPRPLAATAVRSGAGAALAPAWVIVAGRGGAKASDQRVIVAEDRPEPWPLRYEITRDGDAWQRRVLGDAATVSRDGLSRYPHALDGPLPAGRPVQEHLLALCLRRDIPRLRAALTQYAHWAEQGVVALPDELLVDGQTGTRWDPSWSVEVAEPADVVLARALRAFAVTLISGGYSHPWPQLGGAEELAEVLGGLAGRDWDGTDVLERAVALQVRLIAAERGLDSEAAEQLCAQLSGADQGTASGGRRELLAAVQRLRAELAHEKAANAWNEKMLLSRERALRSAEAKLDLLSGTFPARVGKIGVRLVRKARRVARRVLK